MAVSNFSYKLKIVKGGYAIRIEREGYGQEIPAENLFRDGINAITGATSLIERRINGEFD